MAVKSKQLNSTIIGRILTVSFVITIVLLVILLIITGVWRGKREAYPPETESTICEPCSYLRIDNKIPSSCKVNETDICCCYAKEVIDALVRKSATEKFKDYNSHETASVINLHTDCGNGQKASGRVSGFDYDSLKEESGAVINLQPNCSNGQTTSRIVSGIDYDGLKKETREPDLVYWPEKSEHCSLDSVCYRNGRFTIFQSGFYYVFSQIKYAHDLESARNIAARQTHSLYRYSRQTREEKLLERVRSFAELNSTANNGTSFIGAVFWLERNDDIMIKTSHIHKISGNEKENFFGLYMVSRNSTQLPDKKKLSDVKR